VSSFRGANTLFQGQQNKAGEIEERNREEETHTEKRDQRSDQRRRSRKIQAADPKRNQERKVRGS
jgi:hypothetical protein